MGAHMTWPALAATGCTTHWAHPLLLISHQLTSTHQPCSLLPPAACAGLYTGTRVYDDLAALAALKARARVQLGRVDCLLVPTALEHYLVEEIQEGEQGGCLHRVLQGWLGVVPMCQCARPAHPAPMPLPPPLPHPEESASPPTWARNAKNGCFTNFVNLLDMCGLSVPQGMLAIDYGSEDGAAGAAARVERLRQLGGPLQVALPFGVTLLAPAWWDEWLWGVGAKLAEAAGGLGGGAQGHGVAAPVRVRRP